MTKKEKKSQPTKDEGKIYNNPLDLHFSQIAEEVFERKNPPLPEIKTAKWLAKYLNTTEANISRMRKAGLIESIEISPSRIGFTTQAIRQFLDKQTQKATK